MLDYENLTETDKREYARQLLLNPIFQYNYQEEITGNTGLAINSTNPTERASARAVVIFLKMIKERIESVAQSGA